MSKVLFCGADVHDRNNLLKFAVDRGPLGKRTFQNNADGRAAWRKWLKEEARRVGATKVVIGYEASSAGFGIYDEMTAAGFECHVLAPSKMRPSAQERKRKTDEQDAERIVEVLRAHELAGTKLPGVWVPPKELREDREVARAYLDAQDKVTAVKAQVRQLLKRNGVETPPGLGQSWTKKYRAWVERLGTGETTGLGPWVRPGLNSLRRQLAQLEEECKTLGQTAAELAQTERHRAGVAALTKEKGVGLLTALVFWLEMGTLGRFKNRRQVGAYVGLTPSSHESGERNDCKGHITRQGSGRVRRLLCQAVWSRIRYEAKTRRWYQGWVRRQPKRKKVGVVACMRKLAIRLWRVGNEASGGAGVGPENSP